MRGPVRPCPRCRRRVADRAKFCSHCGAALSVAVPPLRRGLRWVASVVGLLLGLCVILGVIAAAVDEDDEPPTPTAIPARVASAPTATHQPPKAAAPTATATAQPRPTNTAAPAPSPSPTATATPPDDTASEPTPTTTATPNHLVAEARAAIAGEAPTPTHPPIPSATPTNVSNTPTVTPMPTATPTPTPTLPDGVPSGSQAATITGYVDGDKLKVSLNREGQTILLAGLDAPEPGECFADEAADRIEELLPKGTRVYLERSGEDRDGRDRLLRYLWVPGADGEDAYLLNTKLVREGFAGFDDRHDNPGYYPHLEDWQDQAQERDAGVWGACGLLHAPAPEVLAGLPSGLEEATVESVTDGDTIRVRYPDGRVEPLRLILIDTPEVVDPNTPEECFGARASEYTAERLTPGTTIWLERDVSDRDQFDRLLRYVWYDDGSGAAVLFNERIVRDGFAVLSTYQPDVAHEGRIQEAQRIAVGAGRGLWEACGGADTPINPPAPEPPAPAPAPQQVVAEPPPASSSGCTYTNVDGNQVPCPVAADSPPPGATAKCRDGTYSFSQNRRGTCSSHGGVAVWL